MKLRVRLLVGYGYLVALLLLTAGSGMLGFLQLSEGIDVILEENFRSISASTHMLEALERQDSATLLLLLDEQTDRADMERFQKAFSDALEEAQANITEDDEEEELAAYRRVLRHSEKTLVELVASAQQLVHGRAIEAEFGIEDGQPVCEMPDRRSAKSPARP